MTQIFIVSICVNHENLRPISFMVVRPAHGQLPYQFTMVIANVNLDPG
jgi:hypothetical protein